MSKTIRKIRKTYLIPIRRMVVMVTNLTNSMTNHLKTTNPEKGSSRSCLTLLLEYTLCAGPAVTPETGFW